MRWKPNSRSSALMRRESVDAGMPSAIAARLKLRAFATSTKSAKSARNRIEFFPPTHPKRGNPEDRCTLEYPARPESHIYGFNIH